MSKKSKNPPKQLPPMDKTFMPPKHPWYKKVPTLFELGATALVVGLWTGAFTSEDMNRMTILLILSFLFGTIAIAAYPSSSIIKKAIYIGILFIVLASSGLYTFHRHQQSVSEATLAAQINEMQKLEQFLHSEGDTEDQLKDLFDFKYFVENNMWRVRQDVAPLSVPKERSNALDVYFKDSVAEIDTDYVFFTTDKNGAYRVNIKPGTIPSVSMSKKYLDNLKSLGKFKDSVLLPDALRISIMDLDKTLHDNITLLTKVINEQFSKDPMNIVGDVDNDSMYLGATHNLYWERFSPLKPKVDKITDQIRNYLNVDN